MRSASVASNKFRADEGIFASAFEKSRSMSASLTEMHTYVAKRKAIQSFQVGQTTIGILKPTPESTI